MAGGDLTWDRPSSTSLVPCDYRGHAFFNFPAFDEAAADLRAAGYEVFSPAEHDRMAYGENFELDYPTGTEDHGFDIRSALQADTNYICRHADGVALLPGWEKSSGARAEKALADALGIPALSVDDWLVGSGNVAIPAIDYTARDMTGTLAWANGEELFDKAAAHHSSRRPVLTPSDQILPAGEVRVTSATGGQKGSKPAQLGAIDPVSVMEVATVAGFGAQKYDAYNYAKGYAWSLSYNALQRHLHAFWAGEDTDPESGQPHLAHAAWHCLALLTFLRHDVGTDDRFPLRKDAA